MIDNVIQLPELRFIAGSYQSLAFELYSGDAADTLDVTDAEVIFLLGDQNKNIIFSKQASGITDNVVVMELLPKETDSLNGSYIGQLSIRLTDSEVYIPAEMRIKILKKVG